MRVATSAEVGDYIRGQLNAVERNNMNSMLRKAIAGEAITDTDIEEELYEVCDRVHSSCDSECPVYKKNGGPVNSHRPFKENRGCDCFKSGKAMLAFIRGLKTTCKG